jgi:hypothetical protein
MKTHQTEGYRKNNQLGLCPYSQKFFDHLWKNKKGYPTMTQCNYKDLSPEATLKRIERPSFRKFFGYKNSRNYDAYFAGHLFQ